MFVIDSCQKIEYNALFMMIIIPVSNFGDQPLGTKKERILHIQLIEHGGKLILKEIFV